MPYTGPLLTDNEDLSTFGFKFGDIVRTPLGLTATVIGVKYAGPDDRSSGRVWVKYDSGHEAPLEPKFVAGFTSAALGYRKCSEADHIRREVDAHTAEEKQQEDDRKILQEVLRCKEQGVPIPITCLDPPKAGKKKDEAGKKGKKK